MKLTGKNKEQFDEFREENDYEIIEFINGDENRPNDIFHGLPLSMQFGVIQDYADSIEILIEVTIVDDMNTWTYDILVKDLMGGFVSFVKEIPEYPTRDEARKAAIKAFDDIVNGE